MEMLSMGTYYGPERPESDFNPRPWLEDAPHYGAGGYDIRDVIEAFGLNFNLGYAVSRIVRRKPGNSKLMDLRKAQIHIAREIAREERAEAAMKRAAHEHAVATHGSGAIEAPERMVPRMPEGGLQPLEGNSFIQPPGGARGSVSSQHPIPLGGQHQRIS